MRGAGKKQKESDVDLAEGTLGPAAAPRISGDLETKPKRRRRSKRSAFWILGGLVVVGAAALYKWWKDLPR
jgi:hypothetical protein